VLAGCLASVFNVGGECGQFGGDGSAFHCGQGVEVWIVGRMWAQWSGKGSRTRRRGVGRVLLSQAPETDKERGLCGVARKDGAPILFSGSKGANAVAVAGFQPLPDGFPCVFGGNNAGFRASLPGKERVGYVVFHNVD